MSGLYGGLFDPPDPDATIFDDPYMGFIKNEIISIAEEEADVETMACADEQVEDALEKEILEVAQGLKAQTKKWKGLAMYWKKKYDDENKANREYHRTNIQLRDTIDMLSPKYPKQPSQPPTDHLLAKGKATMPRLQDPYNAFAPRPTAPKQRRSHPTAKCSQFGKFPIGASPRQIAKRAPPQPVEPA